MRTPDGYRKFIPRSLCFCRAGQKTQKLSHFSQRALYWRTMPKSKAKFRRDHSRAHAHQEIEIKLRVADPSALRLRLKQLRAREIIPRTFESNTLYDTPSRNLIRGGRLIRMRVERPSAHSRKIGSPQMRTAILTFKGPSRSARASQTTLSKRNKRTRFKIRDEAEVVLSNPEQMSTILGSLGLRPTFRYEKFRTTYKLPGIRALKVEFDETPIGLFLELEGDASAIDRAAGLLGYSQSDYMTESYGALYIAVCRHRGTKPTHMVFPATKKLC
jgi:adenylate cyclase class 2